MSALYVIIEIGHRRAAIAAAQVQSVIELETVHPVPRAARHVAGLTALRSQSLTVIDCRRAIGMDDTAPPAARAPVIHHDGHSYALQVDAVHDVLEPETDPVAVPGSFGPEWQRIGSGMIETADGPVLVIDTGALIAGPASASAPANTRAA